MPAQRVDTPDGISWHVEVFPPRTSPPTPRYIVLIPSGEGDAGAHVAPATLLASRGYHVITFDMPGFSRTSAPTKAYSPPVTPQKLATQVNALMEALQVSSAVFFGCSTGGSTVLALIALYPARVTCGIVHEVPFADSALFKEWQKLPDEAISDICRTMFAERMIEEAGKEQWLALGPAYHARLERNYVTWIRNYVPDVATKGWALVADVEVLKRRPLFWTVGALNQGADRGEGVWQLNFEIAAKAGLQLDASRLICRHFPGVTVTEELVGWIEDCIARATT